MAEGLYIGYPGSKAARSWSIMALIGVNNDGLRRRSLERRLPYRMRAGFLPPVNTNKCQ